MFTPARMRQVNVLVLKEDVNTVTEKIAELGVVHLTDVSEVEDWARSLASARASEMLDRVKKLQKRLAELSRGLGIRELPRTISSAEQSMTPGDLDRGEKKLSEIETEVSGLVVERDSKMSELEKLRTISEEVKTFAPLGRLTPGARYTFLEMVTGRVQRGNVALIERELAHIPHLLIPLRIEDDKTVFAAITLKKDRAILEKALREAAFERTSIPPEIAEISADAEQRIKEKMERARREIGELEEKVAQARRNHEEFLKELSERLACTQLLSQARAKFRKTGNAYLISGWVPSKSVQPLVRNLEKASGGRCYVEVLDPLEVSAVREGRTKVPVLFKNILLARPFELLTSTYGVPAYNTIDPTLFVAVTFLIMFGVMFGDIGDGLVLALLGLFLSGRRREERLRKIGMLILSCGISSAIFGFLYGSFFGVERWFEPVWVRPMSNMAFFIKTAIYFGIGVVSLGIIVNIINALVSHDWIRGIFDKAGLLAGVIYWGAVGLLINALVLEGKGPAAGTVMLVIGVPVLLLFMRAPLARLTGKSSRLFPEGALTYFMETLVEVVEIFLGFLANTLSFIRVAAFALAHVVLFMAVFSIADAVSDGPGGTLLSILFIVAGNIVIIVLEGLIVTIQAIRLEYYEFFGKFFKGEGIPYEPIKIG